MGTYVISFSLYGDDPVYRRGALENLKLGQSVYPGWKVRFYVSQEVPQHFQRCLENEGAEVIPKQRRSLVDGTFWRFLAADDHDVDVMISRDVDARLSARERAAVDAWLESGKGFHTIRDHPLHQVRIMCGLWGCRRGVLPQMQALIGEWSDFETWGADGRFLAQKVYPLVKDDILIHSDFVRFEGEVVSPFPVPRDGLEYCGYPPDRGEISQRRLAVFERLRDLPVQVIRKAD